MTDGALGDPAFLDELVDDGRDGAALQARMPGQIRARHWLMAADEVQGDAAIDLPGGLAGRDVEVSEVDFAHAGSRGSRPPYLFEPRTIWISAVACQAMAELWRVHPEIVRFQPIWTC
jgi:hypothetical protein